MSRGACSGHWFLRIERLSVQLEGVMDGNVPRAKAGLAGLPHKRPALKGSGWKSEVLTGLRCVGGPCGVVDSFHSSEEEEAGQ